MSRLRNRIRKADYFTDGELLRWHRDKRTTYSGLWAIAEDSGCLEDDPFSWKCLIWASPLDADITVDLLAQWRDELVDADKLIPYEADGKSYLFIRTFHAHESPRNPQRPDLPIPPWLHHEITTYKRGSSEVSRSSYSYVTDTVEVQHGDSTVTVTLPPPRPAPSRVPKGTKGKGDGVDNGREDKSSSPPVVDEEQCWRCHQPIDPDDVMEDRCVLSRKGLRHEVCP